MSAILALPPATVTDSLSILSRLVREDSTSSDGIDPVQSQRSLFAADYNHTFQSGGWHTLKGGFGYQHTLNDVNSLYPGGYVDIFWGSTNTLNLAGQAMDLEKQVKTAHLGLMIRVKNVLTEQQQDKARALKPQRTTRPQDDGKE